MHEQIAALAASAATSLVQAMTTDGWAGLREGLAGLLGRGDSEAEQRAGAELELSRDQIAAAPDTDQPAVRASAEALWRERLRERLEEEPGFGANLQALLTEAAMGADGSADPRVGTMTFHGPRANEFGGIGDQVNPLGS